MRYFILLWMLLTGTILQAQPLPHGMVYGRKPSRISVIQADKLESFMGKRISISVNVAGRVTLVTKAKGGWFDVDAGKGNIITAHFTNGKTVLPLNLKNHYIVMEGVAKKQFIDVNHQQNAGKNSGANIKPTRKTLLFFEVKGLAVDK